MFSWDRPYKTCTVPPPSPPPRQWCRSPSFRPAWRGGAGDIFVFLGEFLLKRQYSCYKIPEQEFRLLTAILREQVWGEALTN
jgi:hypothetical protein